MVKNKNQLEELETPSKTEIEPEKGSLSREQVERGYYYDDAHGYQTYEPDTDDGDKDANLAEDSIKN